MIQSVLVSKERLFRYQRQTYRGVQGRLQEYWRRYNAYTSWLLSFLY